MDGQPTLIQLILFVTFILFNIFLGHSNINQILAMQFIYNIFNKESHLTTILKK